MGARINGRGPTMNDLRDPAFVCELREYWQRPLVPLMAIALGLVPDDGQRKTLPPWPNKPCRHGCKCYKREGAGI